MHHISPFVNIIKLSIFSLAHKYAVFPTGYVLSLPVIVGTLSVGAASVLLNMALIILIVQRRKTQTTENKNRLDKGFRTLFGLVDSRDVKIQLFGFMTQFRFRQCVWIQFKFNSSRCSLHQNSIHDSIQPSKCHLNSVHNSIQLSKFNFEKDWNVCRVCL